MSNPTKSELKYWDDLARIVGCISCRIDGRNNFHVSIHHCDGRTKKGAHQKVLPLCAEHHQTGGEDAPSIHPWRRRFTDKYGTEEELIRYCNEILKEHGVAA